MATTSPHHDNPQRNHAVQDDAIPAPPIRPPRGRRRPWLIALGITLVATCGVAGAGLLSAAGERVEVLAVAQPVSYGQEITAKDLTTVRITTDPAVQTVPKADLEQVTGQIAGRDLVAGDLLTPSALTPKRTPGTGRALVAIPLASSQLPSQGLRAGDLVQIVSTPGEGGEPPKKLPQSIDAEVVRVGKPDVDGLTVIDVETPTTDGPTLAARVATGRIAIVVDTPGGQ